MEQQYEQALRLYIQKLTGNLSAEEETYIHKMLAEDAAFRKIWTSLEKESIAIGTNDFLDRIDTESDLQELKRKQQPRIFPLKKIAAVAAMFILVAAGAYFILQNGDRSADKISNVIKQNPGNQQISLLMGNGKAITLDKDTITSLSNATLNSSGGTLKYTSADTIQNTLLVPAGKNYKLILSDGTEVWLNAATRLRFPFHFGSSSREVYIDGEAYFKVAKDPDHPFIVHTPLTKVEVLGTSFNVNTYTEGHVETALVEGRVITRSINGESQDLRPGYKTDYQSSKGFTTHSFDQEEVLSWMNGVYYFHSMPLSELADMASRFYGIHIKLDEEKYAGVTTTGLMDRNKLTDFLNDLQTTAHITYQLSGNELTIK
ncbi:FecR family protein [Chitinophaga sp. CF118]|uniref:FecR family protein n=1 Tax=Chitinophaga sp. CF118 TaxID=1884367 RepID=UPI0008EAF811|nr:FecR domain-containing protein [Chitinophaga sp. CF118]SFD02265.1 FecR family protein [Chitinophaga sp. CF118]